MPALRRGHWWILLVLGLTLVVSGCGPSQPSPTPQAGPARPSPGAGDSSLAPSVGAVSPTLPPPSSPTAHPWPPTRTPVPTRDNRLSATSLADLRPIPTPAPPPIVLGTWIAPPEEQQRYLSTTVVAAAVGSGPGEIGYTPPIICGDCCPPAVKATLFAVGFHGDIYIHDQVNQRLVRFDAQGHFVEGVALGDPPLYPRFLDAGPAGELCIYDEDITPPGQPGVACYAQGQWVLLYPKPAWLFSVQGLQITEDGTVWLQGEGDIPGGPLYKCCGYSPVLAPVGRNGEAYDEARQRELAVLGGALSGGSVAYPSSSRGTIYLHDRQGTRIYAYRGAEWLVDIDQEGNLLTIEQLSCEASPVRCFLHRARKYTAAGVMVASFDILTREPEYPSFLAAEGRLYRFTFNETTLLYRVARWERQVP